MSDRFYLIYASTAQNAKIISQHYHGVDPIHVSVIVEDAREVMRRNFPDNPMAQLLEHRNVIEDMVKQRPESPLVLYLVVEEDDIDGLHCRTRAPAKVLKIENYRDMRGCGILEAELTYVQGPDPANPLSAILKLSKDV